MSTHQIQEALDRVARIAHADAKTMKDKMEIYGTWLEHFDIDVEVLKYTADIEGVRSLHDALESCPDLNTDCSILDVASGTGRVFKRLRQKGFTGPIDAVDGSSVFIDNTKSLYRNSYCCILEPSTKLPRDLTSEQYDVAIMCGAMSSSQVEVDCINLLIKAVRAGGILVFTTRTNVSNTEYVARLEKSANEFLNKGVWALISRREIKEFEMATSENEAQDGGKYIGGIVYCFKKLSAL